MSLQFKFSVHPCIFIGTSHNLSLRGGGGGEIGGLQFFLDGIWGGLKMPKDDPGGGGGATSFF